MFDFGIGSAELLMIAIIALIVVGPKDLPKLLKTLGKYVAKIKSMARDFQGHIDDATREAGVDDLKSEFADATDFDLDEDFKKQEAELSKVFEQSALDPADKPAKAAKKSAVKKKPARKKPARKKIASKKLASKKLASKKTAKKPAAKKPVKKPVKKPAKKA